MTPLHNCPISGNAMKPAFTAEVLSKYQVTYYACDECGLLQTEAPYWLDEAYQDSPLNIDTGALARNLTQQRRLEPILHCLFRCQGKFLDLGGGQGILARLLRDIGIDCYSTDKYCRNTFAAGFDPPESLTATGLFAFEVFEHVTDPYVFLEEAFGKYQCKTIIFSTLTFNRSIPPKDWWYYVFEGGQHVSFYQKETLNQLAKRFGCQYIQISKEFHLITDQPLSNWNRVCLTHRHLAKLLARYIRRKRKKLSFTQQDHFHLKEKLGQHMRSIRTDAC